MVLLIITPAVRLSAPGVDVSGWMEQWTLSPNYPVVDASVKVAKLPNGTSWASAVLKQRPVVPLAAPAPGWTNAAPAPGWTNGTVCDDASAASGRRWWLPIAYKSQGHTGVASPSKWEPMGSCATTVSLGSFGGEIRQF